jgi:hypothetical protein
VAVPELQKLLTFQHGTEVVGAVLSQTISGEISWLTIANNKEHRDRRRQADRYVNQDTYIQQNPAVDNGLAGVRALQILNGYVNHTRFGYLIALTQADLVHILTPKG